MEVKEVMMLYNSCFDKEILRIGGFLVLNNMTKELGTQLPYTHGIKSELGKSVPEGLT